MSSEGLQAAVFYVQLRGWFSRLHGHIARGLVQWTSCLCCSLACSVDFMVMQHFSSLRGLHAHAGLWYFCWVSCSCSPSACSVDFVQMLMQVFGMFSGIGARAAPRHVRQTSCSCSPSACSADFMFRQLFRWFSGLQRFLVPRVAPRRVQ